MEFNQKIKAELEGRIQKLENIIAEKGIGSKQLKKAKNVQRNANLAISVAPRWSANETNLDSI